MILIKNGRVVDAKSNTDEILDVVIDGMLARLFKVSGPLGKELDSLADDITFGFRSFRHCLFFI